MHYRHTAPRPAAPHHTAHSPAARRFVHAAIIGSWTLLLAGFLVGPLPAQGAEAALPPATLLSPIAPFDAERLFIGPSHPWDAGHRGIDIASQEGAEVLAPAGGTVTFSGLVVDRGVLTIDHGGGLVSSVEPVVPGVTAGERVTAGQKIASVSPERDHCASATCLHWGVRLHGNYINPLDVLEGFGRVRLLPVRGFDD